MSIWVGGEKRFQFIKLIKMGVSVSDARNLFRIASFASMNGVMAEKDVQNLVEIKQRIDRLTSLSMTRGQAKGEALLKFKLQLRIGNRDEHIAEFLSQTTGMVLYGGRWLQRYGGLINKTDRPRHGTFAPKVGQTRVAGTRRVVKGLKSLMDTLGRFILHHSKDKKAMRGVQKQLGDAARSIQTRTSYKG